VNKIPIKREGLSDIDTQNSLVIDVTYKCNSSCYYCQWGDLTNNPAELSYEDLLISKETLTVLGIKRVVFSGGEPLLFKKITDLVYYYNQKNVESIILMTNGILLDVSKLKNLIKFGLTGITFSIDSLDYNIAKESRNVSHKVHNKILKNLIDIIEYRKIHYFELGLNCVLSAANLQIKHIKELVLFCNKYKIDWLKFQPIFDDGYLTLSAPHLMLNKNHSQNLLEIGEYIVSHLEINSNNYEFWRAVSALVGGSILLGKSCGLDSRQSILIRGELKFCYWLDDPIYSSSPIEIGSESVQTTRNRFKEAKEKCQTGLYCFCLQTLSHEWEMSQ